MSSQGDSRACVQKEVKEWGASIDVDDDIFSMGDLEEFESTDLSYLLLVDVKRLPAPVQLSNNRIHDRETYSTTEEAARKRRRLDISPLYNVISQVGRTPLRNFRSIFCFILTSLSLSSLTSTPQPLITLITHPEYLPTPKRNPSLFHLTLFLPLPVPLTPAPPGSSPYAGSYLGITVHPVLCST